MTATNHAITGATIGLLVGDPFIALPAALLSHFALDMLPHFGHDRNDTKWIKSKAFKNMLLLDALLCVILVATITGLQPHHWFQACICAFLATSPDFIWANKFIKARLNKPWRPSLYSKFAGVIQWFQRPIGAVVEVTWAISGIVVIANVIR